MPSCCFAIRGEFKGPMFDLVEQSKTPDKSKNEVPPGNECSGENTRNLDIVRTFSPRPRLAYIGVKVLLAGWVISIMVMSIAQNGHPSFWLAYLTHWGVVSYVAYFIASILAALYLAMRPPENPGALEGWTGFLVKTTWALFAIAMPASIMITILFWVLEFDGTVSYISIMIHAAIIVLIAVDGFLLSRIPLRMKQFIPFELFCAAYIIWNVIHTYSNIGNPWKDDGTQHHTAIYSDLDWKENPTKASIICLGVMIVLNPIIFLFCRVLSRLLPRRLCNEEEGRRIQAEDAANRESLNNDEEAVAPVVY